MGVSDRVPISTEDRCALVWRSSNMIEPVLPEDKLAILQASDRTITGRQIEITPEPGGMFSVHCPTEGCPALPSDWFYQGNACSPSRNPTVRMSEASIWKS